VQWQTSDLLSAPLTAVVHLWLLVAGCCPAEGAVSLPEDDKQLIRTNLLEAIIRSAPDCCRKHSKCCRHW